MAEDTKSNGEAAAAAGSKPEVGKAASKGKTSPAAKGSAEKAPRRKIPGGFPYTSSPGVLRRVLEQLPVSEKPGVFNTDFLGTVLNATGGAARPIIPIFKATGLLSQGGVPTELYSKFQTESGRGAAALQALKNGFSEIFKRNQFAHQANESAISDIIVSVTGLPRTDPIVRNILSTFQVFQGWAQTAKADTTVPAAKTEDNVASDVREIESAVAAVSQPLGLSYNINVVLPETTNIEVYNAIFRSLRGNLLQ